MMLMWSLGHAGESEVGAMAGALAALGQKKVRLCVLQEHDNRDTNTDQTTLARLKYTKKSTLYRIRSSDLLFA